MKDFEAAAEQALVRYRELRQDAMETQRQMREISGTAVSKRQTVKVTVNVHGEISALEFPTGAYKRMTPTELAEAIKTTTQEAKAKALEDLNALMEPKLQTGLSFKDLIQGKADLAAALPEDPKMPDEVADYIRRGRPGSEPLKGAAS
jgi:DNA-binding protein YbaB